MHSCNPWPIHSEVPNDIPPQIQYIIIRKPASFPGNEDHCSDLSAFAQAEMRNLPTAHYIMVMPWQRLLLRSSVLSQLPRLRQALTTGRQLIIFPRPRAAMLPSFLRLWCCYPAAPCVCSPSKSPHWHPKEMVLFLHQRIKTAALVGARLQRGLMKSRVHHSWLQVIFSSSHLLRDVANNQLPLTVLSFTQ